MGSISKKVLPVIYDFYHCGATSALTKLLCHIEGANMSVFENDMFTKHMNSTSIATPYFVKLAGVAFDMYISGSLTLEGYNELILRFTEHLDWLTKTQTQPYDHTHILVFQWDGYLANPNNWTDEFLEYDYIGAPWYWEKERQVGNGGFSLRSIKLLNALSELHRIIPFNFSNPEDVTICRDYRELLETKYDIKFAPIEVAKRFSFETGVADVDPFGFHGVWNKIYYDGWDDSILDRDLLMMERYDSRDKKIYNVHHLQHMTKSLFVLGDTISEAQLYDHIAEYYPEHVQYLLHYRQSLDKMPASTFDTWSIL